jgi:hypothetical protein
VSREAGRVILLPDSPLADLLAASGRETSKVAADLDAGGVAADLDACEVGLALTNPDASSRS